MTNVKVYLNLYLYKDGDKGSVSEKIINMQHGEEGVWCLEIIEELKGYYYLYEVDLGEGRISKVVDPYAKAVAVNGEKTAIIDLEETNPVGFKEHKKISLNNRLEASIYEVHVRDFSIQRKVGFIYPGKFKAFTEKGLVTSEGNAIGLDHLKEMGITHVQLLPSFDYKSIDEVTCKTYNWGYDPQNYNVPEGSYATDPFNPIVRIREFKELIQTLHEAGIGVVMNVVYNHTYDIVTGPFEAIIPGYFYCQDEESHYTNGKKIY